MRLGSFLLVASVVCVGGPAASLHKSLTQYSRALWTQQQGLPQDTVHAITPTPDGYLWVGADEGSARFDGYEFVTFTKEDDDLPADSVTSLATGQGRVTLDRHPRGTGAATGSAFVDMAKKTVCAEL
jgi:ligand-binding sensor domain-containing protein